MRNDAIDKAVTDLKRNQQWRLRESGRLPEVVDCMLEQDVNDIFSKERISSEGIIVLAISSTKHYPIVVRYPSKKDTIGCLCQLYTGRLIHKSETVLGKIGCVRLIRERISEQLKFNLERPHKISTEGLAKYLFVKADELPDSDATRDPVQAGMKFLNRLNTGRTVVQSGVRALCDKLLIDMQDVVFEVPTIYKVRARAVRHWPTTLWAERWTNFVESFNGLSDRNIPEFNIFFRFIDIAESDSIYAKAGGALRHVHDAIVSYSRLPVGTANQKLLTAADELQELGLDCWMSYWRGLRVGEPNARSKLYVTIGSKGLPIRTVPIQGYLRYNSIIDYDLLPRPLSYIR